MKKLTLLIALAFIIQATAFSQPCLPEGITFTTQEEIDNFQTNHPNCTEIEGDVEISGSNISNLNGLNVLTSIGGDLTIEWNDALNSLDGLGNLNSVGEKLEIKENELLGSLTALNNLTTIGGNLEIIKNQALTGLTGLENLDSIGGTLRMYANDLTTLSGLDNVTSIGGTLRMYANGLTTLSGLDNVTSIGGDIEIDEIDLSSIAALENLTSIEGGFYIGGTWMRNIHLTSLTGLDNVLSIGGDLGISNLDSLTSLTGLDNVTSIGGNLWVWDNDALVTFSGLDNLDSIGGNLEIGWFHYWPRGNKSLSSLEELGNLTSIGGDISIIYNDTLTSLAGLGNINPGSIGNLTIDENSSLSYCEVQSICDYLASPNGWVIITNNAPGCNSVEEVKDSCVIASVDEVHLSDKLSIHPNPFSTTTTIEYELQQPSTIQITIYNHLGKQLEVIQQTQSAGKQQVVWNAEGLPGGVYFCVLKTDPAHAGQTLKMIKLN